MASEFIQRNGRLLIAALLCAWLALPLVCFAAIRALGELGGQLGGPSRAGDGGVPVSEQADSV